MDGTLERDIRRALDDYLSGTATLAEFSRRFATLAWEAEEKVDKDPAVAEFAASIDLRVVEYADHRWTESELRELLSGLGSLWDASDRRSREAV